MPHIFDGLPIGSMDEFHEWREKKFSYTFLCKECGRGFDSTEDVDSCKFCSGPVTTLRSVHTVKDGLTKKTVYRYCCATCEELYTTTNKISTCTKCKSKFLHVYTWNTLGRREKLYIKTQKALKSIFEKREGQKKQAQFRMPSIKISIPKRTDEELPTY